ncbi:MAG: ABC transporter permease [bacterium]|nr:ABC transporter permease [bacterium]
MPTEQHRLKLHELFRLSLRTFRVKPTRAILTIAGMAAGIGAVLFLVSLGYGLQFILIGKLVTTEDSLITMEISYPTESNAVIKQQQLDELKKVPDVAEISPVAEFPGEIKDERGSGILVYTRIVEDGYFRLTGTTPDVGGPLSAGSPGLVISQQALIASNLITADSTPVLKNLIGKPLSLKVFYQDSSGTNAPDDISATGELPIVGIISDETMPPTVIIMPGVLSKGPQSYSKVLVKAKDIDSVEAVRDKMIGLGFLVSARIDLVNQAKKIMNAITIVLGVFGITALIVSAIGMFNTMIVGFLERIYEVGILKSIGATDSDVRNLFLMEAMMMGLFGGIGGVALGLIGGQLLNVVISTIAVRLGGKAFQLFLTPMWFILLVLGLSILIGLASGFWPARRAAGLSPKEAFTKR